MDSQNDTQNKDDNNNPSIMVPAEATPTPPPPQLQPTLQEVELDQIHLRNCLRKLIYVDIVSFNSFFSTPKN